MQDDILIRPALESDVHQIIDLLKISLGEGSIPRDERYWNWKHRNNPFGISPALVAENHGRLVGLRVFMRWSWMRDQVQVHTVRAVDTATHPEWQGRRIFTRLTQALVARMEASGISFIFNTPNRSSMPGYLKMGWSSVGKASLWVLPGFSFKLFRAIISRDGQADSGHETSSVSAQLDRAFSIQEHLGRAGVGGLLQMRARRGGRLSTHMSDSYLRWRYVDIPEFAYYAAGSWTQGEEALIIFRVRHRGGLVELRLCEVIAGPGRRSVRRAKGLILDVIRAIRPDFTVAMAASATPERRVLIKAGFLPAPRLGPMLTVRPLGWNHHTPLLNWSAWRTSIGDLEIF